MLNTLSVNKKYHYVITLSIIIGVGIILRLIQFFYNRSLWLDEASLALSIIDDKISLLDPLPNFQVAPILFLYIERLFVHIFGDGEMSLRFFPLLISLISIPLAYRLFLKLSDNRNISMIALAIFNLSPLLIYYSSEVKQYTSDVFTLLLVFNVVLSDLKSKRKNITLIIAGGVSILVSNIAPLLLFIAGIYYFIQQFIKRKIDYRIYIIGAFWLIIFFIYYLRFIHNHPSHEYMVGFWEEGFMPINPLKRSFWIFITQKVGVFFKQVFFKPPPNAFTIIFVVSFLIVGILKILIDKNLWSIYFIFAPIAFHLVVSAMKIYPFHLRLVLYLSPLVIIIVAFGINWIYVILYKKMNLIVSKIFLITFFLFIVLGNILVFPIKKIAGREALIYITERISDGDRIYINWDVENVYYYYNKIGRISLDKNLFIKGRYNSTCQDYFDEISNLEGNIWFVFSDLHKKGSECIKEYLDQNGKLKEIYEGQRIKACLYDL